MIGVVAGFVAGFAAVCGGVTLAILGFTYHVDKGRCSSWGDATGRDTKFVVLNQAVVPLTWDCFTPDEDGKWIPTSRVRDID